MSGRHCVEVPIRCPSCQTEDQRAFAIACWVWLDCGGLCEAHGDYEIMPAGEPPQLAHCSYCGAYFGPPDGHVYRVDTDKRRAIQTPLTTEDSHD